jgi:hypothetical protein
MPVCHWISPQKAHNGDSMNTKVLLGISLVVNVAAVGMIAYVALRQPGTATVPDTLAATQSTKPGKGMFQPFASAFNPTNSSGKSFDWRTVESTDYRQYIDNLRAVGCPEETIRDIITADVNKLFDARRKAARAASTNKFQFWKTGNPLGNLLDEANLAKQQETSKEKRELLKELLGSSYVEKPDLASALNPYEEILDFLPSSKHGQLLELEQKYAAKLVNSLKDAQKGDFTTMRQVQKEKDAAMLELLTPQEKEEYDLRLSQTAVLMRMQLGDFEPTEQEFRDMFRLQKQFDDEFGIRGMQSSKADEVARRDTARKELDAQMRAVLPEDRFLEYRYSQNLASSSLKQVVEEFAVPRQQALKVFDVQQVAQEQAGKVRTDASLSPEQQQRALEALRAATEKEVGNLIGDSALQSYLQKGSWLKNLSRPARPPTPAEPQ